MLRSCAIVQTEVLIVQEVIHLSTVLVRKVIVFVVILVVWLVPLNTTRSIVLWLHLHQILNQLVLIILVAALFIMDLLLWWIIEIQDVLRLKFELAYNIDIDIW